MDLHALLANGLRVSLPEMSPKLGREMTLPPRRFGHRKTQSDAHRKFIKTFECACWGNPHSPCDIDHPVQAAHYRSAANAGMGLKPGSEWLLPLCRTHHSEQHRIGQPAFEAKYGFSMADKAMEFAAASHDPAIKAAAKAYLATPKAAE